MTKKLFCLFLPVIFAFCIFSACNTSSAGEPATMLSDGDSEKVQEAHSFLNEQKEKSESSKSVGTYDAFSNVLLNPQTSAAAYKGTQDITIKENEYIDKTVTVNTTGAVSLESPVNTLVLTLADGGFSAKAKADNIIISGIGINAEIRSETGNIFIDGKDAVLTIYEKTENIFVKNSTAKIHNLSDDNTYVTLVNGVKVLVLPKNTYNVKDNTIAKYSPEK